MVDYNLSEYNFIVKDRVRKILHKLNMSHPEFLAKTISSALVNAALSL